MVVLLVFVTLIMHVRIYETGLARRGLIHILKFSTFKGMYVP